MKKSSLKLLLIILSIIFISAYSVAYSGYYEYRLQEQTILTNEKIKEFENDIKNNQNIDIKDYLEDDNIDYSNKFTNVIYGISNNSNRITRKIVKSIFKKLSNLIED